MRRLAWRRHRRAADGHRRALPVAEERPRPAAARDATGEERAGRSPARAPLARRARAAGAAGRAARRPGAAHRPPPDRSVHGRRRSRAIVMAELTDQERVALLTSRLGLPEGSLQHEVALQALRHGSYVHERSLAPGREQLGSNERLEFLGDAVLGYLIARRMYDRFPDAPEGDLTRLRASLVREESLAIVARQLGLGELLLLGRGEQRSGGRENAARLADALEAVIAAVLLSCGLQRTQETVERVLAPLFDQGALARDPKTELQQLFQSRRRTPHYQVLAVAGPDHARSYEVEVRLDGTPLGRGRGRSKKEAEQAAARVALEAPDVLDRALLDEAVSVVSSDPRWRELAAEEAARLRG